MSDDLSAKGGQTLTLEPPGNEPDTTKPACSAAKALTDEQLVHVYRTGQPQAMETLLTRYSTRILGFLIVLSHFHEDEDYLGGLRDIVLEKISNEIRLGHYEPITGIPFHKWAFKVAYFTCMTEDKKRHSQGKGEADLVPPGGDYLNELANIQSMPRASDFEDNSEALAEVLPLLSPEEQELMQLVGEKMPYVKIHKKRRFRKVPIDRLPKIVFNIRRRVDRAAMAKRKESDYEN